MFRRNRAAFRASQKPAEERSDLTRNTQNTLEGAQGKVYLKLGPGAGEGSLFAGHSRGAQTEVVSHISSKGGISSLLLLELISGSGNGVRRCWG